MRRMSARRARLASVFANGPVDAVRRLAASAPAGGTAARATFVVLFQMVTGRVPFDGPNGIQVLLRHAPSWRWQDFAQAPFVAMTPGSSVRALTDAAFAQAGAPVRPRFEVAHLVTAGALVAAGLGLAALPGLTLPVLGRGPFVTRDLAEPRMVRRIGVVQATGRTLSPAARAFYREMLAAGSVAPPSGGNRNSRPIFTRFTPLYSMMSAVA